MEHLVVKTELGKMYYQSRFEREFGIDYCIKKGIRISTTVEKVFANKNEAIKYCDKINDVNNLIEEL